MLRILLVLLLAAASVPGQTAPAAEELARLNALESRRAIQFCKRLAHGWLEQADPVSGLLPRNLRDSWFWNAKDCAADNLPFLLLTAFVTDDYHLKRQLLHVMEQEQRLTNRVGKLPDDFLFEAQGFRPGEPELGGLIFGASEYAKDGLTPITEWLGPGPWLDRMTELIDAIWERAPRASRFGNLPSDSVEVNGEMLQVTSRLYWLTGEDRYRQLVFRLTDHYFLENSILAADRLRLDDHACEIIGGLSEGYLVAARTDPERWKRYREPMHAILDRVLGIGRNRAGLLYMDVNPRTGEILNDELTDNWGYNYNAFLTVAEIDGESRYRKAVEKVLGNLGQYTDYPWERNGADGYADSIEGGINLLNRIPDERGFRWVEESMRTLLARQGDDGIIEGWYGDGNSARTALMYALWKTQGVTAAPWRGDLELGAARGKDGALRLYLKAGRPWRGALRFDRPRHRDFFHLPFDYARINQFPEWFTVETGARYRLTVDGGEAVTLTGQDLLGYGMALDAHQAILLTVRQD